MSAATAALCSGCIPPWQYCSTPGSKKARPFSSIRRERAHLPLRKLQCAEPAVAGGGSSTAELKAELYRSLEGVADGGIFGISSDQKSEIEALLELLESQNPTPEPTRVLQEMVAGRWKLIYSTITILGAKRTKLGLREFISLGDSLQIIDVTKETAVNVIKFNVRGLSMLSGQLTIEASYKIASSTRVDIKLESSTITPQQLLDIFRKSYDLLLSIFNPEGWLEITYVDATLRIGRDDKGNIFVLERAEQTQE